MRHPYKRDPERDPNLENYPGVPARCDCHYPSCHDVIGVATIISYIVPIFRVIYFDYNIPKHTIIYQNIL